jgi:hypothetical protein
MRKQVARDGVYVPVAAEPRPLGSEQHGAIFPVFWTAAC